MPLNLRRRQAGLSIVEMLVGVAVGLFLLGGAIKLFVDYVGTSRELLVETRVNQDLRAAADLIARDLRRSGYWQNALSGTVSPAAPAASAALNPYRATTPSGAASSSTVTYAFSRDDPTENNTLDAAETFGFRLQNNAIEAQIGAGNWQQITDPGAVRVTQFTVTPAHKAVPLGHYCAPVCAASAAGCPILNVRRFDIVLRGQAPTDPAIVREIRESVRLRNDEMPFTVCPPPS